MNNMYLSKIKIIVLAMIGCIGLALLGCSKDSYYKDYGVANGNYDGSVLDYLKSKHGMFDSLVKVIKLAKMEDVFNNDSITFFAPADSSIKQSVKYLNNDLLNTGKDTVSDLAQIKPEVWKAMLSIYVFAGVHKLSYYPQIDLNALPAFGGEYYVSINGTISNIGVVYSDAGGVQYAGYRYLVISYIPNISAPTIGWKTVQIATSDITPKNGVVQVLQYSYHQFGFDVDQFTLSAETKGIDY